MDRNIVYQTKRIYSTGEKPLLYSLFSRCSTLFFFQNNTHRVFSEEMCIYVSTCLQQTSISLLTSNIKFSRKSKWLWNKREHSRSLENTQTLEICTIVFCKSRFRGRSRKKDENEGGRVLASRLFTINMSHVRSLVHTSFRWNLRFLHYLYLSFCWKQGKHFRQQHGCAFINGDDGSMVCRLRRRKTGFVNLLFFCCLFIYFLFVLK